MNINVRMPQTTRERLMRSRAPRKLILTHPADRHNAAKAIVKARDIAMYLGQRGYDRYLLIAAVVAWKSDYEYVADELSRAALD